VVEANGEGDDTVFVLGTYTIDQGVSVETLVALNQASTDPLVLTGNEYGQSLYGNLGDNYLNGGQGNDFLVGLAGNDNLLGGTGADNMQGGTGNDVYYVDQAGDQIFENIGEGSDLVVATASWTLNDGAEVETMSADPTAGNINLTGNEFGQSIYGNAGNNILTGMGGADYMVGGAGNDVYYVDPSDFIGEDVGGGDDTIVVATSYTLREGNEIEALVALNQSSTSPVDFTGNEFGQSLYGSEGVNHLDGGAGNDFLVGLGGNDFLIGGLGNDNMQGGTGNDIYYVDSAGDQIFENALEGDDLAVCFASFALGAGQSVETLSAISGTGAINLTGNALAQSLYGNDGANVLTGGGGADYLAGGAGNDMFVLSAGSVVTIADYAALEVVDISQILSVANGTDVVTGGYVRVTAGGQLQIDVNGGGDNYVTLANVSGSSPVTIRYTSGGNASDVTVARSATQEADAKSSQSGQSATLAMAVAAAGLIAEPLAAKDAASDGQANLASPTEASVPHHAAMAPALAGGDGPHQLALAQPVEASVADEPAHASAKPVAAVQTALDAGHASTQAPPAASEAHATEAAPAPAAPAIAAHGIMMPAAELMAAMVEGSGANGEGQHGHLVGKVLAEALHGDANPLDTLLANLPGHEGNAPLAGLAQVAQPGAAGFAAVDDVLAASGFGGHDMLMSHLALHVLATHPDAPAAA
jgi:Ca2+-binding RTX toxin-like protein